ncbi:hypothetical protein P154DRAFT_549157 [Amniculicola lignicola CBS 123094]|uniref:DUF6536 domain-containing protein n=1 Tax=Amniculicola lignicola CBS 123094 TaxID=1392246 RepID=A0A6A5W295_9PLEO|nr:hypothetical protein P154DRAFT_549157 [Amniculicola lignicola CBS 123094]
MRSGRYGTIDDCSCSQCTIDPKSPSTPRLWWLTFGNGWRFGAINCLISVLIVFLINLIVTIWGTVRRTSSDEVVFEGECNKVSKINSGLHLLINLLSTVLLSASNYTMQCLSAPTRKDIDQAHAKGVWLDVGIPSVRNLRYISKCRMVTWLLLGLSSLPLHLFYNSMVYSSIASTSYEGFVLHDQAKNGSLDRLENLDCIKAYSTLIQSSRRNLLLVVDNDKDAIAASNHSIDTYLHGNFYFDAGEAKEYTYANGLYDWICSSGPSDLEKHFTTKECAKHVGEVKKDAANWHVSGYPVQYCLSEPITSVCKLHILLPIGWLVTVLNLIKAGLIWYTVVKIKEDPLITMGDAVASFLERNDPTTKDMCLLTLKDIKKRSAWPNFSPPRPKAWSDTQYRWKDVVSKTRRITTLLMFLIALAIVIPCYLRGIRQLRLIDHGTSLSDLARLGFGAVDPRSIIKMDISNTMSNILIANAPQPILSFLYFSYNGLVTCMLLGHEWVSYAHTRKGLRVSNAAKGDQRSAYFLELPYRFSLPLMGLSGVLHWLVSQSIFLVAIDFYSVDDGPFPGLNTWSIMRCGYSLIAIFATLILGIFMVLVGIGLGFVPYKKGLNLAASCSAAMSAACHGEDFDGIEGEETATSKVKWGVVGTTDGVGRCAFSAREVRSPEKGKFYA